MLFSMSLFQLRAKKHQQSVTVDLHVDATEGNKERLGTRSGKKLLHREGLNASTAHQELAFGELYPRLPPSLRALLQDTQVAVKKNAVAPTEINYANSYSPQ
jgi:hypothetical protein